MTYSENDRKKAVDFYFNHSEGYRGTCRILGFPKDYHILKQWVLKDERANDFSHKLPPKRVDIKVKQKAIKLYNKGIAPAEIASNLQVHYTSVKNWIKQYEEQVYLSKGAKLNDKQIKELVKENRRLKLENDVLSELKKYLSKG